jgi:crossover junction endodeoxyribonuclease RusA
MVWSLHESAESSLRDAVVTLEFRVFGVAQQMGSKRAFVPKGWSRPIVTDSNRHLKMWQLLVSEATSAAIAQLPAAERQLMRDGVRLSIAFYLPRPQSLPRRVTAHTKAPDVDKLVRALGDALSGVAFRDDAQIVDLIAMKRYTPDGEIPHVDIRVEPSAGVVPVPVDVPLFAIRRMFPEA